MFRISKVLADKSSELTDFSYLTVRALNQLHFCEIDGHELLVIDNLTLHPRAGLHRNNLKFSHKKNRLRISQELILIVAPESVYRVFQWLAAANFPIPSRQLD